MSSARDESSSGEAWVGSASELVLASLLMGLVDRVAVGLTVILKRARSCPPPCPCPGLGSGCHVVAAWLTPRRGFPWVLWASVLGRFQNPFFHIVIQFNIVGHMFYKVEGWLFWRSRQLTAHNHLNSAPTITSPRPPRTPPPLNTF